MGWDRERGKELLKLALMCLCVVPLVYAVTICGSCSTTCLGVCRVAVTPVPPL